MLDYFLQQKRLIIPVLHDFLEAKEQELRNRIPWGEDVLQRLKPFVDRGKMIRGGLVLLAHGMYRGNSQAASLQTAAAMELLQTAFLIHDDIMDQDTLRRGEKTIFRQYAEWGHSHGLKEPDKFGGAMGICAGDVAFFLAFELLNQLPAKAETRQAVAATTLQEIAKVGLGQMQDVFFGFTRQPVSEEDIHTVFRCKTAPYTFTLPLLAGAVLADREAKDLEQLRAFGETMGIIFQIRDDELGLFGDQEELGKPVGTDIRQGKKTLFHLYLDQALRGADRQRLREIFGNPDIDDTAVAWVRRQLIETGIRERLREKVQTLADLARRQAVALALPKDGEAGRQVLLEIVGYCLQRSR